MNQKLKLVTPTTVFKPAPYGGVRSSIDLNNFMDSVKSDISQLVDIVNSKIIPVLNGLPLGEYTADLSALLEGLTAKALYIAPVVYDSDVNASYYYHSNTPHRPNTVKEVADLLITELGSLDTRLDELEALVGQTEETQDLSAILEELRDLRNSISEILVVLRSLKFYSNDTRIQAITVMSDPDVTRAPIQTLIGLGPAVKFSATVSQSMYVNFTVPKHLDVTQPIYVYLAYTMDVTEEGSQVVLDLDYNVAKSGDPLLTLTTTRKTQSLTPATDAYSLNTYTGTTFAINVAQVYDLVNIKLTRNILSASPSHTGAFYLLDISFFGKIKEVPQISI